MIKRGPVTCGITLLLLLILGCVSRPAVHRAPSTQPATQPVQFTLTMHPPHAADGRDPQPPWEAVVHLKLYQVLVPRGAISDDTAFWKRIDEQCLSPGQAALLNKNGLRCGIAAKRDWNFFRDQLRAQPGRVKVLDVDGLHAQAVPLELTQKLHAEDIFYFDNSDQPVGQSFQDCINELQLSFGPVPRQPWAVRIALAPAVQSQRMRTDFTPLNQALTSHYADIDRLYDLGLQCDVDDDSFLVIAPSHWANRPSSIGHQFLLQNDSAEQLEQVIFIVPSFLRMDGKPFTVNDVLVTAK